MAGISLSDIQGVPISGGIIGNVFSGQYGSTSTSTATANAAGISITDLQRLATSMQSYPSPFDDYRTASDRISGHNYREDSNRDPYVGINETAISSLRGNRVFVGNIQGVNSQRYAVREDLPYTYLGRDTISEMPRSREVNEYEISITNEEGSPDALRSREPIYIMTRSQVQNLVDTVLATADSKKEQAESITACISKLRIATSRVTDIVSQGLDEDSPLAVEEVLDQCSLEMQEVIDGLEQV